MSPLRRFITVVALVVAAMSVSASCSAQEVQAWFAVRGTPVSDAKASQIAEYLRIWEAQNRALLAYLSAVQAASIPNEANWDRVASCESGGNWSINTGNGYYGGLQFSLETWRSVGGPGYPHEHSRETQIHFAEILQQRAGWGQWGCAHARFN